MSFMSVLVLTFLLHCCTLLAVSDNGQSHLETYIVHVQEPYDDDVNHQFQSSTSSLSEEDLESWYRSFLPTVTPSSLNHKAPTLVYSYRNIFKGFAAKLSAEQVKEMEKKPGFVSAKPQQLLSLHTTHSQTFLGLQNNRGLWELSNYGNRSIIGILDTGIDPDHPSFNDEGIPPPPAKWKGKCQFNGTKACNNKLIGARFFENGNGSPMDENGHGTHTASIAAGNFVKDANVFGNANGTAVGVAPLAHLAIYKVCSGFYCNESDILAGMDAAIHDGVEILSLSLAGFSLPFHFDNMAVGAYRAMEKGIFVSCSAGNSGPISKSMSNEAPWILTVGASTIDRTIRASAVLGNNVVLHGESINQPKQFPAQKQFPLVYPGFKDCSFDKRMLKKSRTEIRGKIVVCSVGGSTSNVEKGVKVKNAGGVGMILMNEKDYGYTIIANAHVLPATHLSYVDGLKVLSYINSTNSPTASIKFQGTIIGKDVQNAPAVAYFSSRGPSYASPGILKPDIIGPGVNILAAWPFPVENKKKTNTKSNFNIMSGTSMSCPHLSGIVALLKMVHPDWSPAAYKSAIMTTADDVNLMGNKIEDQSLLPADPFAIGSGHVNPSKACSPGLVYDMKPSDYIPYLCGLNYTREEIGIIVGKNITCRKRIPEAQLNYPSFSISFGPTSPVVQNYTRTVTNVGDDDQSLYCVEVVQPAGVDVEVKPNTLKFSSLNQKLTYKVSFRSLITNTRRERERERERERKRKSQETVTHGYLKWKSANYSVRSPIVVIFSVQ